MWHVDTIQKPNLSFSWHLIWLLLLLLLLNWTLLFELESIVNFCWIIAWLTLAVAAHGRANHTIFFNRRGQSKIFFFLTFNTHELHMNPRMSCEKVFPQISGWNIWFIIYTSILLFSFSLGQHWQSLCPSHGKSGIVFLWLKKIRKNTWHTLVSVFVALSAVELQKTCCILLIARKMDIEIYFSPYKCMPEVLVSSPPAIQFPRGCMSLCFIHPNGAHPRIRFIG